MLDAENENIEKPGDDNEESEEDQGRNSIMNINNI
jgi:hypothetical protein